MSCSLPVDCLNEVFENLEDDKITLHSCLLVNRLWCKISVKILWRNIWSVIDPDDCNLEVASSILCTLISCLPVESKELLDKNEIFISTPTSNPPLFDYAAFCKVLSINKISQIIHEVLDSDTSISSQNLILKEILKTLMDQVTSLKMLTYDLIYHNIYIPDDIPFTSFPGARDCLTDLSELHCSSDIRSEFFYQLSRICHNLRSLAIKFESEVPAEGLKELVSSQNNLKYLKLTNCYKRNGFADIIPALIKHSNTLTKLHLYDDYRYRDVQVQLSFVSSFLNLQEFEFSFDSVQFVGFEKLQYVTLPKLQILKIPCKYPKPEYMKKFLKTNGKSLQELYIFGKASNLSIDKYCPNLKKLFVTFDSDELDMLKIIFNSCQNLEGIVMECGVGYLNEKKVLETVVKHSPKNFYELKLFYPEPENLESFFVNWKNRESKKSKSISLIIVGYGRLKEENIEKYKNLGIFKKFELRKYCDEELYL